MIIFDLRDVSQVGRVVFVLHGEGVSALRVLVHWTGEENRRLSINFN